MRLAVSAACIAALWAVPFAPAAEHAPQASAVIEKYIERIGGRAALEKLRTQVLAGTIEITGKGVSGVVTVYRAAPDRALSIVEFAGMGKMEEGTDGQVAWSRSAMSGPRIKEGGEKAFAIRGARFHGDLNWRDLYTVEGTAGTDTVEGRPCYRVVLTPKNDGEPVIRYYDQESGLPVKMVMKMKSPQGEVTVESLPSDYRRVGELTIPHKIVQRVMGTEIVTTFTRIENNAEVAPDRFALPPDVKALLAKKAK